MLSDNSVIPWLSVGIAVLLGTAIALLFFLRRRSVSMEESRRKLIEAQFEAQAKKAREELLREIRSQNRESEERFAALQAESDRRSKELIDLQQRLRVAQQLLDEKRDQAGGARVEGQGIIITGTDTAGSSVSITSSRTAPSSVAYLQELELTNIRCFEKFKISLVEKDNLFRRVLLLGDNASGKSTVLRAIALALCNESDAASLMTTWPGSLIRNGADFGAIRLVLRDSVSNETCEILKKIQKASDGSETLRHSLTLKTDQSRFPSIFVCGYGTQRARAATASVESYSPRQAVATLFDEGASLQNPELVFLRYLASFESLRDSIMQILLLDAPENAIDAQQDGLRVVGPWGSVRLDALSDGYRSTLQWLVDLSGWLVHAGRLGPGQAPAGILLIDEIEQHLHPRWQRYIMQRLSSHLPGLQLIATTHTPLVASGLADVDSSSIVAFRRDGESIESSVINPLRLRGKRADQVLTEFFELATTRNPGSSVELTRLVHLRSLVDPSPMEKVELASLESILEPGMQFGETAFERKVEQAVSKTLDTMLREPPEKELEDEVKRQLRELFADNDPSHD